MGLTDVRKALEAQLAPTEYEQVKLEIARLKQRLDRLEKMVETLNESSFKPQPLYLRQNV